MHPLFAVGYLSYVHNPTSLISPIIRQEHQISSHAIFKLQRAGHYFDVEFTKDIESSSRD